MTRARKFRPAPLSARLDADVLALWDIGLPVDEIAASLGVDEMRVAAIVAEIGAPSSSNDLWEMVA